MGNKLYNNRTIISKVTIVCRKIKKIGEIRNNDRIQAPGIVSDSIIGLENFLTGPKFQGSFIELGTGARQAGPVSASRRPPGKAASRR
jgi:hypothetical protein